MRSKKKNIWLALLMVVLCLMMVACSGEEQSSDEIPESDTQQVVDEENALPENLEEDQAADESSEGDGTTSLPEDLPGSFIFSSGAGAWGSSLTLNPDGTFTGSYHDSEMGEMDEDYPNGTVYQSEFSGKFGNVEKINDWSYALTLTEVTTADEVGTEWIENGIRFVAAEAFGLVGGTEFILYTPEAPTAELAEEFLSWNPGGYIWIEEKHETLERYALRNLATEDGFYAM